ncbi:hypothetical protein P5G65_36345 [Paenibacillus chondroitinus]|uniref:Uncharacterized protein n=1 Tax=Paenibacillus chondroitinus TaxID=59842 RepID=A0ABU6DP76_9BACL|nr:MULTISPECIES: hypothetical protein [Paenibacillus]MCY9663349.1 hypothetical protein [Paenibacillus anseongense]MEB4799336.1 hypothetical protein [Paenibacillus chondroitinus]
MNQFILRRFNGTEIFNVSSATVTAKQSDEGISLWFEVETDSTAIQRNSDTESMGGSPNASFYLIVNDIEEITNTNITIPTSYNNELQDYVTTIYYYDHNDINNNIISIKRVDSSSFYVKWNGTTMDCNFYDGSKPETQIEIETIFNLIE